MAIRLSADKKAPIEAGLTKLKEAHASRNFADIDAAQAELAKCMECSF